MDIRIFTWLAAFAANGTAVAAGSQFGMEEPFAARVPVSATATKSVRARLTAPYERFGCVGSLPDNLEASLLDLGPKLKSILIVKPKGMCLCGVYSCHFWILQAVPAGNHMRLIGEVDAYSLTILAPMKGDAVPELKSESGAAGTGRTTQFFRYIGGHFVAYRTEHS